jgi:hypothetical protein
LQNTLKWGTEKYTPREGCGSLRTLSIGALRMACIVLFLCFSCIPFAAVSAVTPPPVKLAVFDFELNDVSAAGALSSSESPADLARMQTVTGEARRLLAESGRYSLIDTHGADATSAKQRSLRNCDGCEAAIALKLGAERSLVGVVTRVAQTEYYFSLRMMDTGTGKVIDQQTAFFTGADDAWASGVRMVLKHTVLADPN